MRPRFSRTGTIVSLVLLALVTSLFVIPAFFISEAQNKRSRGAVNQTLSQDPDTPNYDIRLDKAAFGKMASIRARSSFHASEVADVRDNFVRGEERLRGRVNSLKVEYSPEMLVPEVIAPDVKQGKKVLTSAQAGKRSDILKRFLKDNSELIAATEQQVDELTVAADYTNPDGNLSFVELNQAINGIPVFRGEVKAGFTRRGEIARVINNLAPGLNYGNLSIDFGDPAEAVRAASGYSKHRLREFDLDLRRDQSTDIRAVFGGGDFATTAEKMYFPLEPGVAVPSWRVLLWQDNRAYYVIVDAASGEMLWRKNLTEDQTQAASYRVYTNPNAMVNVADSPFPLTPGPTSLTGQQGAAISRTLVTRVGNEAPYTFNNLGWITDGNNTLDGNNVQAGLDRESPNAQSPVNPNDIDPNGVPTGSGNRVFDFAFSPGVPTGDNSTAGDDPLPVGQVPNTCLAQGTNAAPTDYQKAITTQLFYITNVYHDEMYRLGFTEAARNFQNDNFGRGGAQGDRVSAQAQDCGGANNANFTTPADGSRGSMQMYLWTNPTPDFDGSLDADVVIHELTHGTSNRLHGNASGLGSRDMSRAMGEGWSDFYAHAMLSEPTDPIDGIYPTGGYATYKLRNVGGGFYNYYYGIRRFPKAVMAFTGGPNNRPHNPMTFADIDSTKINLNDGAFAPAFTATAPDGVHAGGEIWSSALWEIRAKMVTRLGWAEGNRRVLQLVTDGMKLAPLSPTFLSERDAIIAAALAGGTAEDVKDIWEGFAIRGMGASASIQVADGVSLNGAGTNTTRVTEAFDLPNLIQSPAISISDSIGDNDGIAEPGEEVFVTVPLTNQTGNLATNVTASVNGSSALSYGSIAHNATASNQFRLLVPSALPCGSVWNLTINVNSSLGPVTFNRTVVVGSPVTTITENFDSVAAPNFPAGWVVAAELGGTAFVNSTLSADTAPNAAYARDPNTVGGGTTLTSPTIAIQAPAASVSFRHSWNTENGWDGGVLEIAIGGGAFQDIVTAGGSFVLNGYNGALGAGTNNPIANRSAWTGNSGGFVTTTALLPASAAGQNVQLRWRFGADDNTVGSGANPGWYVDTISVVGSYTCSSFGSKNVRSDFDGDGRSDVSVFRPSNGGWYMFGSTSGFMALTWGLPEDEPVPADYDQDGRTDVAVFRRGPQSYFYILSSKDFTFSAMAWGTTEDIPVVEDYDGDKFPDVAVYRPSTNGWYWYGTASGFTGLEWGQPGDVPVAGDFDGDGRGDQTVFRNGTWITRKSAGGQSIISWGFGSDKPVPADYDGDGADDIAIFRPSDGSWWILRSSDFGYNGYSWGVSTDLPVPGDYDGDGKADLAIFRDGAWWILYSKGGYVGIAWGFPDDKPTLRSYIPH